MTRLSTEATEALANQLLLNVAPGQITGIAEVDGTVEVTSVLASPFADKTPSLWLTVLSAVDGHTISSNPTRLSVDLVPCACGTGTVVIDPDVRATGFNDEHVRTQAHMVWATRSRKFTPQYPVLFRAEGERCSKVQYRTGGRVHLQCVRRVHGREVNHLMDIMDRDAVAGSR